MSISNRELRLMFLIPRDMFVVGRVPGRGSWRTSLDDFRVQVSDFG